MELTTYIALSRLAAQQRAMDVTANNLANASTPGFKASRTLSDDWLSDQIGTTSPGGERKLAYTQDRATYRDTAAGPIQHTANPFDLALSSGGFFTVSTPRGPRLTRAGRFSPLADGTVGDMDGNKLLDTSGQPLRLSPDDTDVSVTADGTVSSANGRIGKIGVVAPADPNRMTEEGARLLRADAPTAPVAAPKVIQGAVEDSNVNSIAETTRMMDQLRSFQFTSQLVQSESDRMQSAIDKIIGRNA